MCFFLVCGYVLIRCDFFKLYLQVILTSDWGWSSASYLFVLTVVVLLSVVKKLQIIDPMAKLVGPFLSPRGFSALVFHAVIEGSILYPVNACQTGSLAVGIRKASPASSMLWSLLLTLLYVGFFGCCTTCSLFYERLIHGCLQHFVCCGFSQFHVTIWRVGSEP